MRHSCLGAFLAFLLVIFFIVGFTINIFYSTALNPKLIETELDKSGLWEKSPQIVTSALTKEAKTEAEKKQMEEMVKKGVTSDWVKTEAERNINALFVWLSGKSQSLVLQVNLNDAQKELLKSGGEAGIKDSYKMEKFGPGYQYLNPQEQTYSHLPAVYQVIKYIMWGSFIMAGLMLVFLVLMCLKSLRSIFRWVGVPLMIASFGFLVMSFIAKILVNIFTKGLNFGPNIDKELATVILNLITNLSNAFTSRIMLQSGIIFAVGLVMVIVSFFFKKVILTGTTTPAPATPPSPTSPQPAKSEPEAKKK